MYIGNGRETTTATVLYSLKIRKGGNTEIYQELARNGEEHGKNSEEPNADLPYGVARAYGCW